MKEDAELRAKHGANLWQAREAGEGTSNPEARRTLRKSLRVEEVVVQQLVLSLTRGGPSRCSHDNYDRDELSEAGRWSDAVEGIGRTHSSRKATRRGPAWRHAARGKRDASARPAPAGREGGEGGNMRVIWPHEKPAERRRRKPETRPERNQAVCHGKTPGGPPAKQRCKTTNAT